MRRVIRDNGLSIVLLGMFILALVGQSVAGWSVFNEDRQEHGIGGLGFLAYLLSAQFIEATAENWESEFLQMAAYVVLTVFLYQRGSSESKDPDRIEEVDAEPASGKAPPDAPWPVRAGGWILGLYRYSLSFAFLLLFLASFAGHALSGARLNNLERMEHGRPAQPLVEYLASGQFWFESLQNWQSEFLAILAMVVLSIFLRQKGSPESKPVATPHFRHE
jgi:hypothetical protein